MKIVDSGVVTAPVKSKEAARTVTSEHSDSGAELIVDFGELMSW